LGSADARERQTREPSVDRGAWNVTFRDDVVYVPCQAGMNRSVLVLARDVMECGMSAQLSESDERERSRT
jgi:hypothetical protein